MITRPDKLENAKKFYAKNFKKQTEFTAVVKVSEFPPPEYLSFGQTPFSREQSDIRRLDKMSDKLVEAYKFEDSREEIITVSCPLRLLDTVQAAAKEKLGDKYISIVKDKK